MALNPRFWFPIAIAGVVVNVFGLLFALRQPVTSFWHAGIHVGLIAGFWAWAQQLKGRRQEAVLGGQLEAELGALHGEVAELRQELAELQERMDFAERLLSQARELERLPQREPNG